MSKFSINEALRFGWETTKANFALIFKILLVIVATYIVTSFIHNTFKNVPILGLLASILLLVVRIVLDIGVAKVSLKFASNQTPQLEDLYNHYPLFWKYLGGSLLSILIIGLGLILLIVPGIIFAVKLQFVSYLIVDKQLGPVEAIKKSWQMTNGVTLDLFIFDLAMGIINVLGAIALVIGLLWTIPTTAIATASVYRKLSK